MNEGSNHIHISLDQMKRHMAQSSNDDVDMLKSRTDNIELMQEKQIKLINDIEASMKHCIYPIYCKL
jgi:hypothetical protein